MKIVGHFVQAATEKLDYHIDYTALLEATEIVQSSIWVAAGLTIELVTETDQSTTVWLSGGVVGQSYAVINTITSSATPEARVFVRALEITIV